MKVMRMAIFYALKITDVYFLYVRAQVGEQRIFYIKSINYNKL